MNKHLVISSIQKTLALRQKLNQLKAQDYPSNSPIVLIELLDALCENIHRRLVHLGRKEQIDENGVETDEVLVLGRAVAQLIHFVGPAASSSADHVPWSLIYPVELLCRQISPETRVIIYPNWEFNYTYYETIGKLKKIMDGVEKDTSEALFKGYPRYFATLSFPASEGLNVLQNAAWGHEIGHHLNSVFGVVNRVMKHPILDPRDVDKVVDEFLSARVEELSLKTREQIRVGFLVDMTDLTEAWVSELVADLFSVHVFGPASLFAFADIVSILYPLDQPDHDHPPARFRMSVMLNEIKDLGYDELFTTQSTTDEEVQVKASVIADLTRLRSIGEKKPEMDVGLYYQPVMNAAKTAIPLIKAEVKKLSVSRWACTPDALAQDVFKLVGRLANEIPPCEVDIDNSFVGKPTQLASIVNAGWFYRIWRRSDVSPQNEIESRHRKEHLDQLNELILKAVELSDIERRLRPKDSAYGYRRHNI